jgi:hypothetical protein
MAAKDEIIIELGKRGGGDIEFPPTMGMYRGRFSQAEMAPCNQSRQGIARRLPTVPGLCVALDIAARTGRIFDPLGSPERREVLAEVAALVSSQRVTSAQPQPVREQRWERLNDDDIKSWHHWMRRLVEDDKHAKLLQGRFLDTDKLPGRTRLDFVSDKRTGPVYKDEFDLLERGEYVWPGQPGYADQQAVLVSAGSGK